jgi:hypothetical protein
VRSLVRSLVLQCDLSRCLCCMLSQCYVRLHSVEDSSVCNVNVHWLACCCVLLVRHVQASDYMDMDSPEVKPFEVPAEQVSNSTLLSSMYINTLATVFIALYSKCVLRNLFCCLRCRSAVAALYNVSLRSALGCWCIVVYVAQQCRCCYTD